MFLCICRLKKHAARIYLSVLSGLVCYTVLKFTDYTLKTGIMFYLFSMFLFYQILHHVEFF